MIVRGLLGWLEAGDGLPVRVIGVIDTTRWRKRLSIDEFLGVVEEMTRSGVDVIELQGRSASIEDLDYSLEDEAELLAETVRLVSETISSKTPIAVSTTSSLVASKALKSGASIILDYSGLRRDPLLARVVADYGASLVIGAYRPSVPDMSSPLRVVVEALKESIDLAEASGLDPRHVLVDPGLGFFKPRYPPWYMWDSMIMTHLAEVGRETGKAVVVTLREELADALTGRGGGSAISGLAALAVWCGAHVVRVKRFELVIGAIRVAEYLARLRGSL